MSVSGKKEIETSLRNAILELETQLKGTLSQGKHSAAPQLMEQKEKLERHLQNLVSLESPIDKEEVYQKKHSPAQSELREKHFKRLGEYLQKLVREGNNGSFFMLMLDDKKNYYFQFYAPDDVNTVIIEAVSNSVLSEKDRLSAKQIAILERAGWILPANDSPNFQLTFEYREEDLPALMGKLKRIAREAYGVPIGESVVLSLNFG